MRMPFGKHRGKEIEDLPQHYLWWLYGQPWLSEQLKPWVEEALGIRRASKRSDIADPVISEIVRAGYRELVKKNHPDVGGSNDRMAKINEAYDVLKLLLQIK